MLAFEKFDSKKHSGIIAYFNKNLLPQEYLKKNILRQAIYSSISLHR
ncbi:hypothetical protein [Clostridium aceticum]|nr:hypothetical protein [Clostridium aceticum]